MTPITDDEIQMLVGSCDLPVGKAPLIIRGTSTGMFSVARHYGGMRFGGHHYTYCPADDSLYRDDVLQWLHKTRKQSKRAHAQQKQSETRQAEIFGDQA